MVLWPTRHRWKISLARTHASPLSRQDSRSRISLPKLHVWQELRRSRSLSLLDTPTHVWIYSQNDHLIQVGQIAPIPKWRSQKTNYPISNPLMNWIKETTLYPIPSPFTLALPKAHQSIDPQIPSPSTTDQPITPLAQI